MSNVGRSQAGNTLIGQGVTNGPRFAPIGTDCGLTEAGVVIAHGTDPFTASAAGSNGQVLIGATGADPAFGTITSTDGSIDFTLGANTLNMAASDATKTPIGAMAYFATENNETYPNPTWLKCDGSAVNQADYPTLYQRVGLISEAGTNFVQRPDATITVAQYMIALGNSTYVSVGASGSAYTSLDGITWTARTSGTSSSIRTLTFGGGIFVFGGNGGVLSTSTDGITWTARTSGTTSSILTINYANNIYVFSAAGGGLSTSTDAITWTARTSGTANGITSLSYLNSLFVYGGALGTLATSTDAITWTARTSGTASTINVLWYVNSLFHFGANSFIYTSTDAITWIKPKQKPFADAIFFSSSSPTPQFLNVNGTYILTNGSNYVNTSTDGFNFKQQWLPSTSTRPDTLNWICYDGSNSLLACASLGGVFYGSVYSYNTATQFKLPEEYFYDQNTIDNLHSNLYIKAL